MALGFQDCCNSSSYFYLDGIPATVSQNEFYHIITLEGPAFCATYTTIPALNYQPPTYTLVEMTEYTNCDSCFLGASLTCPAAETIFLSQFGPGSISVGTDCSIRTLFPMIAECASINPTFDGFADGIVRVFVTGGTPPYSFFNPTDGTAFGGALPVQNSVYTVIDGALEGEYPIQVVDAQSDFSLTLNCVLSSPPTILTLVATTTPVSIAGACDGTLSISVTEGTPPYQIFVNGLLVTETTFVDLCAGDYEITAIDSGVGTDQQITSTTVTIGSPAAIVYPARLCLSFTYCGTRFALTFTRSGNYNFRANYTCDNPEDIGLTSLLLRWEAGWTTTQETSNGNLAFDVPCAQPLPSLQVKFVKLSNQTQQPTGNWQGPLGLFQGINVTVDPGVCEADIIVDPPPPPVPPILTLTANNAQCGQVLGSVILVGSGGAGAPYTYFINGVVQASSTVTLAPGSYVATVTDANGANSTPSSFTIGTTPSSTINMNFTTTVQQTNPQNPNFPWGYDFSGQGGGRLGSYYPVKIVVNLTGIPSGQVLSGYFNVTVKKQSLFNETYGEGDQSQNEIDILSYPPTGNLPVPTSEFGTEPPFVYSDATVVLSDRPFGINNNFIPFISSNGCTSPNNTYRTVTRQYTIGDVTTPVQFYEVSITDEFGNVISYFTDLVFYIGIDNVYQPNNNFTCESGVALQIEVEFVKTSVDTACTNFVFNNGNPTYIASSKQIGNTSYLPETFSNTQIIN